jgi:hypothetical protein
MSHADLGAFFGSTLDSLFEELGEREDVELLTQKKLLAAKIERPWFSPK